MAIERPFPFLFTRWSATGTWMALGAASERSPSSSPTTPTRRSKWRSRHFSDSSRMWKETSYLRTDNKKGCAANQHAIIPCNLGKSSPRTFYQGSHYSDTSWPDIILGPVRVRLAIRQPSAWSAIRLCENRASMTNANEDPHLNIRKCRATNCRINNLVCGAPLSVSPNTWPAGALQREMDA
ncbi:hypothetical protein CEXT_617861 [Caerostris extrusa]|uniref:Uncharacterized protein n=1 Tax=Caerostris extrusa TaxID=172846 RepID=A0AAV4PIG1_CAEEX|nr:hypothetical protein CEXT_617861 [Caerostris extrusa]